MNQLIIAPLLFSGVVLAGCASTLKVESIANSKGPQSGFKYELPMTQFEIEISRRAVSCKPVKYIDGTELELVLANEVKVKPGSTSDPERIYSIDPSSPGNWFSKTAFSIEYHSGSRRIKTINGSVEDKTSDAVVTIIKTVAGLGTLPSGTPGTGAGESSPQKKKLKCKPGLEQQIAAVKGKSLAVKTATERLTKKNAEITAIKVEQAKLLPAISSAVDNRLAAALRQQEMRAEDLRVKQAEYAVAAAPVTVTQKKFTWPKNANEFNYPGEAVPEESDMEKLTGNKKMTASQRSLLKLDIFIANAEPYAREVSKTNTDDVLQPLAVIKEVELPTPGIYYRDPAQGMLVIRPKNQNQKKVIHNKVYPISQLGFIDSLPVRAAPFESIEFSAEFAKDGRLTKGGYNRTAAPGTGAIPVAETIAGLKRARQVQADADLAAQIARLENEKKLKELLDPQDDSGDVSLLEEELILLSAEQALLNTGG